MLLSEDPAADLSALTRWRFANVAGRIDTREAIDTALKRYEAHFNSWLYTAVFGTVASMLVGDYATRGGPAPTRPPRPL